jgi:phosphoribosylformylglycinamidine synthase
VRGLCQQKLVESSHDISDGGLICCLLESAFVNGIGFKISSPDGIRKDAYLFGEGQGRAVVTVKPENENKFLEWMRKSGVDATKIGTTASNSAVLDGDELGSIAELKNLYDTSIEKIMN